MAPFLPRTPKRSLTSPAAISTKKLKLPKKLDDGAAAAAADELNNSKENKITVTVITAEKVPVTKGKKPKKGAGVSKKSTTTNTEEFIGFEKGIPLEKSKVKCPICISLFVEPVTFPCHHSVCLCCYKEHIEKTSLCCPLCRLRVSVWSRLATKSNKLVNQPFWDEIKSQFPEAVERRLNGDDALDFFEDEKDGGQGVLDGTMVDAGELRKEYDTILQVHNKDLEKIRQEEEEASARLIQELQNLENQNALADQANLEADLEFARKLQEERSETLALTTLDLPGPSHRVSGIQADFADTQEFPPIELAGLDDEIRRLSPANDEDSVPDEGTPNLDISNDLLEEQRRVLQLIEQEKEDFKLAKKLQRSFNTIVPRDKVKTRNSQPTIIQSMMTSAHGALSSTSTTSSPISTSSGRLLNYTQSQRSMLKNRKRKVRPKHSSTTPSKVAKTSKSQRTPTPHLKSSPQGGGQPQSPNSGILQFFKPLSLTPEQPSTAVATPGPSRTPTTPIQPPITIPKNHEPDPAPVPFPNRLRQESGESNSSSIDTTLEDLDCADEVEEEIDYLI